MARIKQLYATEHEAKTLEASARASLRQEKLVPLLIALKIWLDEVAITALPKSPLGEAVTYARHQWAALNVYVTHGALAIDNNIAERAVKPYAIGRKNWLFFGSDHGGQRLAILSSFTATYQQFGVNPWTWLQQTLTRLPLPPPNNSLRSCRHRRNSTPRQLPRRITCPSPNGDDDAEGVLVNSMRPKPISAPPPR